MRWSARVGLLTVAASLVLNASSTAAQDIEAASRRQGIELPAAYYQQLRANPDMYEFERALFNRVQPGRTSAFGEARLPVVLALFNDSPERSALAMLSSACTWQRCICSRTLPLLNCSRSIKRWISSVES